MLQFTIRDGAWLAIALALCFAGYRFGRGIEHAENNLKLRNAELMVEQAQTRLKQEGLPPLYNALKDWHH